MATVPWRHLDSVRTFTEQLARGMCNTLLFLFVAFAASYLGCLSVCVCICNVYCYLGQHQWHQSTYKNISKKIVSSSSSSFYFRCGISIFHCSIQIDMRAHNFFFCSLRFYLFYFFFSRIYS